MMSYIYVLCSGVLHQIICKLDSALIVTKERNLAKLTTEVTQRLLRPQELGTTSTRCNIFSFGGG
jgi:hypothetical protein